MENECKKYLSTEPLNFIIVVWSDRGGPGPLPPPLNPRLHVRIDALCELRWPPEQHSGKKSRHILHLLSPRTIGNFLLAVGLRPRVSLVRLSLPPRHRLDRLLWCRKRIYWRVECRCVVFSGESRFCLFVSDGRTHVWRRPGERHLPECNRPQHRRPHLRLHGVGHGCARVAHCVTARWRNLSHYCRPLRQIYMSW